MIPENTKFLSQKQWNLLLGESKQQEYFCHHHKSHKTNVMGLDECKCAASYETSVQDRHGEHTIFRANCKQAFSFSK